MVGYERLVQVPLLWRYIKRKLAFLRFLPPRVDSHDMSGQMTATSKRFVTYVTNVRSFSSMASHMSSQMTTMCKAFLTYMAFVWFISSMDSHMGMQITLTCKRFMTYHTSPYFIKFPGFSPISFQRDI